MLKPTINTTTTNLIEGKCGNTNTFAYGGTHGINVESKQKLIDIVSSTLALEYHTF